MKLWMVLSKLFGIGIKVQDREMKKLLGNTLSKHTVLCLFLLFLGLLINTLKYRSHTRKLEKTSAIGNVFLEEKLSRFTQVGHEICNQQIFNSYVSLHNQEKEKEFGRFLIYHILDDDVVGIGCRITGALYALALSISTNRALVLSGVEFEYRQRHQRGRNREG